MAGDWIKMRGELWTHPRFLALSTNLIHGPGMREYIHGNGGNESVTEQALPCVTDITLRDVTMCALLRVWCAVNAHCKVDGLDAIYGPMHLHDLDDLAGLNGFGTALWKAGWVERDDNSDSLIFKNFCEHNEPAILRQKQPMSNAERQRKFRENARENRAPKKRVTAVTKSNGREEKRREEKVKPSRASRSGLNGAFSDFWASYKRKKSKGDAEKAWIKINPDEQLTAVILAAVERAKTSADWTRDGGKYIPYPATWLNAKGWEDEIQVKRPSAEYDPDRVTV